MISEYITQSFSLETWITYMQHTLDIDINLYYYINIRANFTQKT